MGAVAGKMHIPICQWDALLRRSEQPSSLRTIPERVLYEQQSHLP
jgi:hypothetical protein